MSYGEHYLFTKE